MASAEGRNLPEREILHYDVVIVGAGPAGLAAAIRLKQLSAQTQVVVLEKASEIGRHILSGAIIDPKGLNLLLTDWQKDPDCPLTLPVQEDEVSFLTASKKFSIPHFLLPPLMKNKGNFVGSLGKVVRYLSAKAEELGVEIYPGFAASEIIYTPQGAIKGVATRDMGLSPSGEPKENFVAGIEVHGHYVLFAEGARGSLSKQVIQRFQLDRHCDPQKFGLGLKELWQIDPEKHIPGRVEHSLGWPLTNETGGGSFLYHIEDGLLSVGFVVHLNYSNPHLSPFEEFQRFKTHPAIAPILEGGKRLAYGARSITEGGWQSVPRLVCAGGALVGCAAGFVNLPRLKGSHNAIVSGLLAAQSVHEALGAGRAQDELIDYEDQWRASLLGEDLKKVRNVKPLLSKFGTRVGVFLGGMEMWCQELLGFSFMGTLHHKMADHMALKPLSDVTPILYPKPDGRISFDKMSSVFLSDIHHREDQPCHLILHDPSLPLKVNLPLYGEPAQNYCPAGVYEITYIKKETGGREFGHEIGNVTDGEPQFIINSQNCVHCKACDIKDPQQNITWIPPEGGDGPNYQNM